MLQVSTTLGSSSKAITILADSNIAYLNDYFNVSVLGVPVIVTAVAGRDITSDLIKQHQPDALLVRSVTQVDAALLTGNSSVQFVGSATIGTDHIDDGYLQQRGIVFANAAGSSKHSVAQYVVTAILKLRPEYANKVATTSNNSSFYTAIDKTDATYQTRNSSAPLVKLGIIGLGNIGSTLAAYAQDLGWQILGYDPVLPHSAINNVSFETLLTQSDVISLHVPLTTAAHSDTPTQHLIDANALALIPAHTLLINTARGPVIGEAALLDALTDCRLSSRRQVVLDVFEHEPTLSACLLDQLTIATPHIAGYTLEGKLRGTQMVFESFIQVFAARLQLSAVPALDDLLPPNPYRWQQLQANLSQLSTYYDIMADDKLLKESVNFKNDYVSGVSGAAFDALRKNYALRREWQFEP